MSPRLARNMKTDERIRLVNGYDEGAYTYVPVIIVGAGESGIAMASQIKQQLGFDQFRVYDRHSGIGGTWWINRYPGVACDLPTIFYSYSFMPNLTAKRFFPSGSELVKYFQVVAAEYRIVDKVCLNTDVTDLHYLEDDGLWEATLQHMATGTGDLSQGEREALIREKGRDAVFVGTEKIRAKVAISCVGGIVAPKDWPEDVVGRDDFKGHIFHSARWRADVDLTDKNVVVVGTGCSAAQLVPRLTKAPYRASSVTQLMRSPPWVVAKAQEPFGKEAYAKYAAAVYQNIPGIARTLRTMIFLATERDWFQLFGIEEKNDKARARTEESLLRHMKKTVPEKYHKILTPDYGVGCKRRIFDDEWLPAMNDPKIHLTTKRLASVQEDTVTLSSGGSFPDREDLGDNSEVVLPADVIVLANGFDTHRWLHPLKITGRGGKEIHDVWHERGGPQAYMGTAMDGFPNMFIIIGPNTITGHSSVMLATENMVNHSLKFIRPLLNGDVDRIEIKREAELTWTRKLQRELKDTVFMTGGCTSWYLEKNGWNSVAYSRSQIDFGLRCMFPAYGDWDFTYTAKGLRKRRLVRATRFAATVAAFAGLYWLRRHGIRLASVPHLLRSHLRLVVVAALGGLGRVITRLQAAI